MSRTPTAIWETAFISFAPRISARISGAYGGIAPARTRLDKRVDLTFHDRTLEEIGIRPGPELHRIAEDKITEVALRDETVVDQFVRFNQNLAHVSDIEVTDVGAEQRLDARTVGIHFVGEAPGIGGVVGFAAEVEVAREEVEKIRGLFDLAGGVIVDHCGTLRSPARGHLFAFGHGLPAVEFGRGLLAAVLLEQLAQQLAIEIGRINLRERPGVALFPVADQVAVELTGPANAAFEKGAAQRRKAPRHAANHQRLANCLGRRREMTDMVVGKIRRRHPETRAAAGAVKGRREAQLDALRPHRIVVIFAVEPESVVRNAGAQRAAFARERRDGPADDAAGHDRLQAERLDVLQLRERLGGRMHRDGGGGREAVGELTKNVRDIHIEAATGRLPHLGVADRIEAETGRRVEHGEIDAEFVEAMVEQLRQHRSGAIARVPGRKRPPGLLGAALVAPLRIAHRDNLRDHVVARLEAVGRFVARDFSDVVENHRLVFDPVPVRIDYRMAEPRAQLLRVDMMVT